jgi:hypothetical protein
MSDSSGPYHYMQNQPCAWIFLQVRTVSSMWSICGPRDSALGGSAGIDCGLFNQQLANKCKTRDTMREISYSPLREVHGSWCKGKLVHTGVLLKVTDWMALHSVLQQPNPWRMWSEVDLRSVDQPLVALSCQSDYPHPCLGWSYGFINDTYRSTWKNMFSYSMMEIDILSVYWVKKFHFVANSKNKISLELVLFPPFALKLALRLIY